ncbi:MAG: hypothetical protein P0Y52_14115 [Candidatus Brevundimonas phytovorans]|nr:hypothetical protein [Brevundimonas sp.]WEK57659.1 MAG: hypothetical protein P0Y52_14115 [Brevundimonas sp.]
MTTADYALIVSIFSASVAIASFAWNVWSKWLYPKAKLRVGFAAIVVHFGNGPLDQQPRFLRLAMTNFGPTELTVTTAVLRFAPKSFWKRGQNAIVNPVTSIYTPEIAGGPFAGGLPKKLGVGETFDLFFPHDPDSFARQKLNRLGVIDTFGRFHGAPRVDLERTRKELDLKFSDGTLGAPTAEECDFGTPA